MASRARLSSHGIVDQYLPVVREIGLAIVLHLQYRAEHRFGTCSIYTIWKKRRPRLEGDIACSDFKRQELARNKVQQYARHQVGCMFQGKPSSVRSLVHLAWVSGRCLSFVRDDMRLDYSEQFLCFDWPHDLPVLHYFLAWCYLVRHGGMSAREHEASMSLAYHYLSGLQQDWSSPFMEVIKCDVLQRSTTSRVIELSSYSAVEGKFYFPASFHDRLTLLIGTLSAVADAKRPSSQVLCTLIWSNFVEASFDRSKKYSNFVVWTS